MTKGSLKTFDSSNYIDFLLGFADQIRKASSKAEKFDISTIKATKNILICGMGGSAIAGDLLKSYFSNLIGAEHINIIVNRDYEAPGFVDNSYLVILSSYSGNTEEVISAYHSIEQKTKNIVVVSTGGKLKKLFNNSGTPFFELEEGYQPRAAIGMSFFTQLYILMLAGYLKTTAIQKTADSANQLLNHLDTVKKKYNNEDPDNPTFSFANLLKGRVPIIYSSSKYSVIARRFVGQLQENANQMSFFNSIPEMCHNEINIFSDEIDSSKYHFINIFDDQDNDRVLKRFKYLEGVYKKQNLSYSVIKPNLSGQLGRYFELIYYIDWVSYWLALMKGVDPSEINTIIELKEFMKS